MITATRKHSFSLHSNYVIYKPNIKLHESPFAGYFIIIMSNEKKSQNIYMNPDL